MKKITLSLLMITGLYASDLFVMPTVPDKVENEKTIEGIDSNNNGVRDDVELYIYNKYKKILQKDAMIKYARVEQENMITKDHEKYIEKTREIYGIYWKNFNDIEVDMLQLEEVIVNTNLRKNKF